MCANPIRILQPNVTQEEALRAFSSAGASALYWRIRSGPLRRIADLYVPYFLFCVKCTAMPPRLLAMDAVDGSLDLFEFPQIPGEGELLTRPSRNLLGAALSEERAAGLLRDKVSILSSTVEGQTGELLAVGCRTQQADANEHNGANHEHEDGVVQEIHVNALARNPRF